ncbi:hypothetical protein RG959_23430 [Domibacillus sp. 8LH]|uniref:hypothetical protein n=1 Tax=Domibacillus sp. 8LH TaxID=3073900 RepID=UPI00317F3599
MTTNETISLLERELKQTEGDLDKFIEVAVQRGEELTDYKLFLKEMNLQLEFARFRAERKDIDEVDKIAYLLGIEKTVPKKKASKSDILKQVQKYSWDELAVPARSGMLTVICQAFLEEQELEGEFNKFYVERIKSQSVEISVPVRKIGVFIDVETLENEFQLTEKELNRAILASQHGALAYMSYLKFLEEKGLEKEFTKFQVEKFTGQRGEA